MPEVIAVAVFVGIFGIWELISLIIGRNQANAVGKWVGDGLFAPFLSLPNFIFWLVFVLVFGALFALSQIGHFTYGWW